MSEYLDFTEADNAPAELEVSEVFVDAVSPRVSTEAIEGGHRVTVTDVDGSKIFDVMDGADGQDGISPTVDANRRSGGVDIVIRDKDGADVTWLEDGQDGETPIMMSSKSGTTTTVTFSTTKYQESFEIEDGAKGAPGADGYSPTASVSKTGSTATITITDKTGTTTETVSDGAKGDPADPLTITGTARSWGVTASPDTMPSSWSSTMPTVEQGKWLWCRTRFEFSDGTVAYATNCAYQGVDGDKGDPGDDYVLTAADKQEIAGMVLADLPTWTGGTY